MGYKSAYGYFRADAHNYISQNRTWAPQERNWTVSTLWAGDPTIRQHYELNARGPTGRWRAISPGLPIPNPIPVIPFNYTDVRHAKETGTMPAPHAPAGVAVAPLPPQPLAPQGSQLPTLPPQHVPGGQHIGSGPHVATGAVPHAATPYVSTQLHDFWPRLPWPPDPELPPLNTATLRDDQAARNAWVDTEPHIPLPSDGTRWAGIKSLGVGGYGIAGLWVQADETDNIRDRMVIKETKSFAASEWRDPKNWRDRLPREIRIHQLIEGRRVESHHMCRHIVCYRAYRLMMALRKYRLYLDFYGGSDLHKAMADHSHNWNYGTNYRDESLPEAFIWYVIKSLASACLVLQKGTTTDEPLEGWRPITHLDMQLPNVLLHVADPGDEGEDEDEKDNAIPPVVPVLADFGFSFYSPDSGGCPLSDNPEDYLLTSIYPTYPPEMHQQEPPYNTQLGEKTDVWGIGRIAWTLTVNTLFQYGPVREQMSDKTQYEPFEGYIPLAMDTKDNKRINDPSTVLVSDSQYFAAASRYSEEIRQLVRDCLNYDLPERPSLKIILDAANRALSKPNMQDDLLNKHGLGLKLPQIAEFSIGAPVDGAKRRAQESGS